MKNWRIIREIGVGVEATKQLEISMVTLRNFNAETVSRILLFVAIFLETAYKLLKEVKLAWIVLGFQGIENIKLTA